jgi:hypothetical protein
VISQTLTTSAGGSGKRHRPLYALNDPCRTIHCHRGRFKLLLSSSAAVATACHSLCQVNPHSQVLLAHTQLYINCAVPDP